MPTEDSDAKRERATERLGNDCEARVMRRSEIAGEKAPGVATTAAGAGVDAGVAVEVGVAADVDVAANVGATADVVAIADWNAASVGGTADGASAEIAPGLVAGTAPEAVFAGFVPAGASAGDPATEAGADGITAPASESVREEVCDASGDDAANATGRVDHAVADERAPAGECFPAKGEPREGRSEVASVVVSTAASGVGDEVRLASGSRITTGAWAAGAIRGI